jgi:hypothetical protein
VYVGNQWVLRLFDTIYLGTNIRIYYGNPGVSPMQVTVSLAFASVCPLVNAGQFGFELQYM